MSLVYETWLDLFSDPDFSQALNFESMNLMNLLGSGILEDYVKNIKKNEGLIALTLDPIVNKVLLVHNFIMLGGTLYQKASFLAALYGFRSLAQVVRFKELALFFKYIIEKDVPAEIEISNFKSAADFKNFKLVPSVIETF